MKNELVLTPEMVNQAIATFEKQLLSSEIADHIFKIIQFGSTLKGKVPESSDVDLMIVSTDGEKVREEKAVQDCFRIII